MKMERFLVDWKLKEDDGKRNSGRSSFVGPSAPSFDSKFSSHEMLKLIFLSSQQERLLKSNWPIAYFQSWAFGVCGSAVQFKKVTFNIIIRIA